MSPRIAFVSPLPPESTGIADYGAELALALAERCQVILVSAERPALPLPWRTYDVYHGPVSVGADLALYQMGNSHHHDRIARLLVEEPGVTVLHDPVIHHAISAQTERRGDDLAYYREMAYSAGPVGAGAARRVLRVDNVALPERFPLSGRVLDASLLTVVHSQDALARARLVRPTARLAVIPHLVSPVAPVARISARERLGLEPDALLLGSFGLVTTEKRIPSVLSALGSIEDDLPDWRYLIVGEYSGALGKALAAAPETVRRRSVVVGRADWESFGLYQSAVDVAINLRWPTFGETSGAVLRLLARGTPVIVSDAGAFRELPQSAVIAVPTGETEIADLGAAILRMVDERAVRGEAARAWATTELAPHRIAGLFVEAFATALEDR